MKNKLTLTFLAVAVSQVMAVVPIPIKECTKTVVVDPKYDACTDFARDYNITFKDLLQYNEKLRKDCMNLDTGEKMCVSINPGGINPPLVLKAKKEKTADSETGPNATTNNNKKGDKEPKDGKAEGVTGETAKPSNIQDKKPVAMTDMKKDTPIAAVVPPAPANGASNAAITTPSTKQQQDTLANRATACAVGTTSSMMLAAAGVAFSVIYML
ncbi:hypothetical protein BGZ95_011057 [Linnemannia exigua]|uniref:LysM domain-containing protein n=1 Tax=Linnemannia exigua TaxID=604196 RepID=A0AAD4DCG0_9FUNG|nr:hypothetical protein BGZ95_011057 [Linnemannia exigua]